MGSRYAFDDLVSVMAPLRRPVGCRWDRAQTPRTLRPYLLEELHEVLEAIDRGDQPALREELGDLLLQVGFHARMAEEAGRLRSGEAVRGHWQNAKQARPGTLSEAFPEFVGSLARAQKAEERVRLLGFRWPDLQ